MATTTTTAKKQRAKPTRKTASVTQMLAADRKGLTVQEYMGWTPEPLVLITLRADGELSFVPGRFNEANFWPLVKNRTELRKHIKANPGNETTRMPYSLARELFGFEREELWLEAA